MGMYAVQTADTGDLAASRDAAAHGRSAAMARRRALAAGQSALGPAQDRVRTGLREAELRAPAGADSPPGPNSGQASTQPPPGGSATPESSPPRDTAAVAGGLADARLGRAMSIQRRRQLSQGKSALPEARGQSGPAPAAAQVAPSDTAAAGGLADARLGRAMSIQRRRQLALGKSALPEAGGQAVPNPPGAGSPGAGSAETGAQPTQTPASSAGFSRPQSEGRIEQAPKVVASPTHGAQRVTGLRIGPGVQVTGDEAGSALPVSGSQYVAAGGPAPARAGGPKVGLVRTPQGLVVSGTTVRNKVSITGDEAGEHLPITGEAEPKLDDDLTPRPDGAYASAQFPRRADPQGATALGTRLGAQSRRATRIGSDPRRPVETTDGGLNVSGTALGRSGRVTGDEAGACRSITGDQYQGGASYSSECGGTGGGTAPAEHLAQVRRDPVTLGKVTEALTWTGQRITGPSVEHRPNVTGDEPGSCRPVTGTPYQGPSTTFGWCEPDEGEGAATRLETRPVGSAVTGDVPMHDAAVTGTERGRGQAVSGTQYYDDFRDPQPAAQDWTYERAFPVALARRQARVVSEVADSAGSNGAAPPTSTVPGGITGSFAISQEKVTGNSEFLFSPRQDRGGRQPVVTGEGRTDGPAITGSAWTVNDRVTGTEGYIAAGRNPSQGGGTPHGWAGARKFRDQAKPAEEPRQMVTGRSGGGDTSSARVTLSGGAQG